MKSPGRGARRRRSIYLASPCGFNREHLGYLSRIKERLSALGFEILDPWDADHSATLQKARRAGAKRRAGAFLRAGLSIGAGNEATLRKADIVLGVLDGTDVDSGVACEMGLARGLGKRCYGLRCDWRNAGDLPHLPVNLQIVALVHASGGRIFRSVQSISIPGRKAR